MTDDYWDRYRTAARACERTVFWHEPTRPAQVLAELAKEAEELHALETEKAASSAR